MFLLHGIMMWHDQTSDGNYYVDVRDLLLATLAPLTLSQVGSKMVAAIPPLPTIGQYLGSIQEPSRPRRSNLAFSFLQS